MGSLKLKVSKLTMVPSIGEEVGTTAKATKKVHKIKASRHRIKFTRRSR